jgi:hypothetical protein
MDLGDYRNDSCSLDGLAKALGLEGAEALGGQLSPYLLGN